MTNTTDDQQSLPLIGQSRWKQLQPFVGMDRKTFQRLAASGRAPQGRRVTARVTVWNNAEIRVWLRDPVGWAANVKLNGGQE